MQFINGMALLDIKALRILRLKNKVLEKKEKRQLRNAVRIVLNLKEKTDSTKSA